MATPSMESGGPAFVLNEGEERYRSLLAAARETAAVIVATPAEPLTGAAAYIHRVSRELVEAVEPSFHAEAGEGAAFECLRRLVEVWPQLVSGRIQGEQAISADPALWKHAMTEWPMGDFARMAADYMIAHRLLGGAVLELGAGVGSCGALVADHVGDGYIRSDLQPFLLRRQKIRGAVAQYDFNQPGQWRDLDTIFAVNALHCAKDKVATLNHLRDMLRTGGVLVLAEGRPYSGENRVPWALNGFFGLFRGWWDVSGFVDRDEWFTAMNAAGFRNIGWAVRSAGSYDLGGLILGER